MWIPDDCSWAVLLGVSCHLSPQLSAALTASPMILFLKNIYLFIWLCWVLVAAAGSSLRHMGSFVVECRFFVTACGLLSSCGAWALEHTGSVVAVRGLSSCGVWALKCSGSVVAACRLSCPAACGILVPQPGIEPTPALEGGLLTPGPPGKSLPRDS